MKKRTISRVDFLEEVMVWGRNFTRRADKQAREAGAWDGIRHPSLTGAWDGGWITTTPLPDEKKE